MVCDNSLSNGFLQSEVLGEVSVLEGGSSGRSFSRSLPRSFPRSFRPCFAGTFRANKNFSKNFSPKFPWPCTAKLEKFQGKKLHDEVLQGDPRKTIRNATEKTVSPSQAA